MNRSLRLWSLGLLVAALAVPALAQSNGEQVYKAKCAMCHGQDGLATTPVAKMMSVPSFKSPAVAKLSEAEMLASVNNGKGKMPAYKGKLTDAQIHDVVVYIRQHLQK
ncbi:MAG: cytochrome c [Acidobacteriaceae bacterium]